MQEIVAGNNMYDIYTLCWKGYSIDDIFNLEERW